MISYQRTMSVRENRAKAPSSSVRAMKGMALLFGLCALALVNTDILSSSHRALAETRKLCRTVFNYPDWKQYWEDLFAPKTTYTGEPRALMPMQPNNIGYVLTLTSCPKDGYAGADPYDPDHAFYDAAALLKYSIVRNTYPAGSKYNATMYAIVHPKAVVCKGPNHEEYDRVKVLQDLGYKVDIVGSPVWKSKMTGYVKANIDSDAGDRDIMRLHGLNFAHHPAIVLVDFTTLMLKPMDPTFDSFIQNSTQKVQFSYDYPTNLPNTGANSGMNPHWVILKPDPLLYNAIAVAYANTDYSPNFGWASQGIKDFKGVLGMKGFLVHYFTRVARDSSEVLSRCYFANDASNPYAVDVYGSAVCRDPLDCTDCRTTDFGTIYVIKMIHTCGKPWACHYDETWDEATKTVCEVFHQAWFSARVDFEQSCWVNGPPSFRAGTFKPDVFLGFCSCSGVTCYDRMIDDKAAAATCDKDTQTTMYTGRLPFPNGGYQDQRLSLTTGQVTGSTTACVTGTISLEGFEAPYNLGIVIDVSGSTSAIFKGTAVGNVNTDTRSNTILDAELAAVIAVLENIAESPVLGNDNVNIGLIKFSTDAKYLGMFMPCDPNDSTKVNPALLAALKAMRYGGYTHFDDGLDKAILYFNEAPPNRNNILMFLSDGIPNVVGDGDDEERTNKYENNQPGALEYTSEIAALDALKVKRIAVGVGAESDVRVGFGLDMIDNTPDPYTGEKPTLATSTDALKGVLLNSPLAGQVTDFKLVVDGEVQNFDKSHVKGGPTGFYFGQFIVNGLDPRYGAVNVVTVTATVNYYGGEEGSDTENEVVLTTTNLIPGTLA